MSGTMRKMGVYLGLLEGSEDELGYDDPGYAEARREQRPARREPARVRPEQADAETDVEDTTTTRRPPVPAQRGEVANLADRRRSAAPAPVTASAAMSRIVTLHPRTYNEAKVIGENFRDGVPVIMNLSEMSDSDAKRLVDFAAGLIFSVRGSIERVTNKVFLLSPPNVFVAAEDKERIAEGGFFNQS